VREVKRGERESVFKGKIERERERKRKGGSVLSERREEGERERGGRRGGGRERTFKCRE
jgi:hypothetical protein